MALMSTSGSVTSTQRSTSFDDISLDGNNYELTFSLPPSGALDMGTQERPYGNHFHSTAEIQHQVLRDPRDYQTQPLLEPVRSIIPPRHCRMNMAVVVDLEALFPDGTFDFNTGQPVVNLDSIHIFTFTS